MTLTATRKALATEGIGASEVPVIAEASPWVTPVELWLQKLGRWEQDQTSAMRAGSELERALLKMGSKAVEQPLRHNRVTFRHPDWPAVPLYATPDGLDPHHRIAAEVKLVSHHLGDWTAGVPEYVGLQVQAQLAVMPQLRMVLVIALVGGELRTFRVERDALVIERLPELVTEWWQRYVVADVAPPALTPADDWLRLRARFAPTGERSERLATTEEQAIGQELLALIRQREAIDVGVDRLRRQLAQAAAETDVLGVGWSARWSSRASTNWRGVAADARIPQALVELHTSRNPTFTVRRTDKPEANE